VRDVEGGGFGLLTIDSPVKLMIAALIFASRSDWSTGQSLASPAVGADRASGVGQLSSFDAAFAQAERPGPGIPALTRRGIAWAVANHHQALSSFA
jgi:hypothetical protein